MTVPILLECPHCHHSGTISKILPPGSKVRCPSCRKPFAFEPPLAVRPAVDTEQEPTLSEPSRPLEMGGLSVFTQTELVETVSEATVARALAESRRKVKRGHPILVGLGIAGLSVLLGLGLLSLVAQQNGGDNKVSATLTKPEAGPTWFARDSRLTASPRGS